MGNRPKDKPLTDGPGPSQYNPEFKAVKPRAGVAGMGKAGRDGANPVDGPGPGAYYSPSKPKGGISMGIKHKGKGPTDGPGPGAYDGNINNVKDKAPGVKMGAPGRAKGHVADTPGPGNYESPGYINPGNKPGGFSFGKE